MITLFHTSPDKITEIHNNGLFGSILFFAAEPYFMTSKSDSLVYSLELNENGILEAGDLDDYYDSEPVKAAVSRIVGVIGCDEEQALDLLCERIALVDYCWENGKDYDGEDDWFIQRLSGECAFALGFKCLEATDEQGVCYMISPAVSDLTDVTSDWMN
ncbi:MAG: hypothetical protein ACRCWB_11740 [Enterovibrio sp.]